MCPQHEATELRKDIIMNISDELQQYGTLEVIQTTIISTLFDDEGGTFGQNVPDYDHLYSKEIHKMFVTAAAEQDVIEHQNFYDGHISSSWKRAQEAFYRLDPTSRRNGNTWSKRLIKSLYNLSRKLWDHRNAALFANNQTSISYKRRAAFLDNVEHKLSVGHGGIRKKKRVNNLY